MLTPDFGDRLAAAKSGDDAAFAQVWRDLNPSLVRYCVGMSGDPGEDAAAETWIEVVKRLPTFAGDSSDFRSWLFTIARSKIVDAWRRESRRPADTVPDLEMIADLPAVRSAADEAMESISTDAALALIAQLPREQAEIVLLRVIAGLDVAAVASIVGCSVGNVRVRQHRGLRKLAEVVEREKTAVTQ